MDAVKGKVLTVLGPIDPSEVGVALPHEHLFLNFTGAVKKPEFGPDDDITDLSFTLENLGTIRHFPYSVSANLSIESEEDILSELQLFKQAGGGTVCDVTTIGIRLDSKREAMRKISQSTGVHIVSGTAFYVDDFIPEEFRNLSESAMADLMVKEITEGVNGSRCGIIGEVGCSYPLTELEKRSLKAAVIAQKITGAPLIIHPGRDEKSPIEILDVLQASGADISRTVMSHLDRTIFDNAKLLEVAERGCYLEYDLFGIECSHYQFNPDIDFPNDGEKIQKVKFLVDSGYENRILLSHDIHTKHRLVRYGGHGYAHVLENIAPYMALRGISQETISKILRDNPRKWLTFV